MAVDAATGAPLWQFQTNVQWKASPMTYVFDGRQHVAVAAGPNIMAFSAGRVSALADRPGEDLERLRPSVTSRDPESPDGSRVGGPASCLAQDFDDRAAILAGQTRVTRGTVLPGEDLPQAAVDRDL